MPLGAGRLDQRVEVIAVSESGDGYGGQAVTETSQGTVWAHVEPVRGQERVIADQARGVAGYRITARNFGAWAGVGTGHVLVWNGARLDVRWAPDAGRGALRMIEAEAGRVT